jgi:hypothetical protein
MMRKTVMYQFDCRVKSESAHLGKPQCRHLLVNGFRYHHVWKNHLPHRGQWKSPTRQLAIKKASIHMQAIG